MIPNPIDSRFSKTAVGSGGYLAFLGRFTSNKGVDVAIAVARRTKRTLVIAANVSKEEGGERFFASRLNH